MVLIASAVNAYGTTPVAVGTWTQLTLNDPNDAAIPSNTLPYDCNAVIADDDSGSTIELGIGAPGAQVVVGIFNPNYAGTLPILLNAGMSIWARATDAAASTGSLTLNFMKGARG